jgi:cellulose synthase/poly-beta-1,6-N-acetylglucosamine synthase-like glycosyltransferase
MDWIFIFSMLCIFLFTCYSIMLLTQTVYWLMIPNFNFGDTTPSTKVSVIIAMRNEEKNIIGCLEALLQQDYPVSLFEVIVKDDHSTDNSVMLVREFAERNHGKINIYLSQLKDGLIKTSFKKFAISEGIKKAKGDLIITTDADCIAGKKWLSCIVAYFEKYKPVLMMCPVTFESNKTIFSRIQALEFAGLIGMSASANKSGFPLMCNGANLAYSKIAFQAINGFGNTPEMASGDDTFLLFKMMDYFPEGIHFIKSTEAEVSTLPQTSLRSFFQQRKRWASKTTKYDKSYVTLVGLLTYFFNVVLVVSGVLSFFYHEIFELFILILGGKIICEFIFMFFVCKFLKKKNLLSIFLPASLLYIPYILMVGIASQMGTYQWKGRTVK